MRCFTSYFSNSTNSFVTSGWLSPFIASNWWGKKEIILKLEAYSLTIIQASGHFNNFKPPPPPRHAMGIFVFVPSVSNQGIMQIVGKGPMMGCSFPQRNKAQKMTPCASKGVHISPSSIDGKLVNFQLLIHSMYLLSNQRKGAKIRRHKNEC